MCTREITENGNVNNIIWDPEKRQSIEESLNVHTCIVDEFVTILPETNVCIGPFSYLLVGICYTGFGSKR